MKKSQKGQLLLHKWSNQTVEKISKSPNINTQGWEVITNFNLKQDVARDVVLRIPPLVHLCQICIYLNTPYKKWKLRYLLQKSCGKQEVDVW